MDERAFGRGVRALRVRRRWRQADLADAAGLSRGVVARIEQGQASRVTVATLDRIALALDARVACRLSWHGEELDRLLDQAHAGLVERTIRSLASTDWLVATEVSFNHFGDRGSVDVLAFHPGAATVLVVEVKSVVPDLQSMLHALDRKARLGTEIAMQRGWNARTVARLLVIQDSRTARRRIAEHAVTFATAFPQRGPEVRRWLREPAVSAPFSGLWLLSSESRAVAITQVRGRVPRGEHGASRRRGRRI